MNHSCEEWRKTGGGCDDDDYSNKNILTGTINPDQMRKFPSSTFISLNDFKPEFWRSANS